MHLTQRCNLSCAYCYADAGKDCCDELTTDDAKRILSQIAAFQPRKVVFTGGEPLMREDIFELARFFRESVSHLTQLCINTNGWLLDPGIAASLVELFHEIRISVDGFEETNDALRGKGAFRAAIRAIGEIRKAGGVPSIAITLTSVNAPGIQYFIHYMCHEWGIRTVRINPMKPMGRGKTRPDLLLHERALDCPIFPDNARAPDERRSPCNGNGSCVGTTISISPQGLAYPCHWLSEEEHLLGDLKVQSLSLIYDRLDYLRQRFLARVKHPL